MLRHAAPIQLVIVFIGTVLLLCVVGILALALMEREVPEVLATVCVSAVTGLLGLLAPNTGLIHGGRAARDAELAGTAAAMAVMEHTQLHDLAQYADDPDNGNGEG